MDIIQQLAAELNLAAGRVESAVKLIDDGNTIPFIARYRKEATGSLTDTELRDIHERLLYLRGLDEAREKARASIDAQGKLTEELSQALAAAKTLTEVEDLYRPYRPKRRTRATIAKEKGLEPLALLLLEEDPNTDPPAEAERFLDPEKELKPLKKPSPVPPTSSPKLFRTMRSCAAVCDMSAGQTERSPLKKPERKPAYTLIKRTSENRFTTFPCNGSFP